MLLTTISNNNKKLRLFFFINKNGKSFIDVLSPVKRWRMNCESFSFSVFERRE